MAGEDLKGELGEDTAAGGIVRGVVGDCLGRGVGGDGEVLGAVVGGADEGGLRPGCAGRDGGGGGDAAVDEGDLVNGEVGEADGIAGGEIGERRSVVVQRAHAVADVVEAGLPADEVLEGLADDVDDVVVEDVRGAGGGAVGRADRHYVAARRRATGAVQVGGARREHVDGVGGRLDGLRGDGAGKK